MSIADDYAAEAELLLGDAAAMNDTIADHLRDDDQVSASLSLHMQSNLVAQAQVRATMCAASAQGDAMRIAERIAAGAEAEYAAAEQWRQANVARTDEEAARQ